MKLMHCFICVVGMLAFAQSAHAQVRFFFPGASAFTPEISVVNTGALSDVQATVSADRKYVTLNMRPQNSTLLALRSFNFQQGGNLGNVGDPPKAPANNGKGGKDDPSSVVLTSPSDVIAHAKSQASVLHQTGMMKVGALGG